MGYTHYFTFKSIPRGKTKAIEVAYQAAIADCNLAIKHYYNVHRGDDASLSGYSAHSTGYGGIEFNGCRGNDCEPFVLREHYKQNLDRSTPMCVPNGFRFCKTRQYYYDTVVTACLIILKHHLGDQIEIGSDGDSDDFIAGLRLVKESTLITNPVVPFGVHRPPLKQIS